MTQPADAAPSPAAPRRRSRLLWAVLILSLALNVFFIGGFVWARMHGHGPRGPGGGMAAVERFEQVAKDLQLTPPQRTAFEQFVRSLRQRSRHVREQNQPLIDEAFAELQKPQPDDAVLQRSLDAAAKNRRAFMGETSEAMRRFLATLDDGQRARFVALLRDRQGAPPLLRQLAP